MPGNFSAKVDDFVRVSKERMEAVTKDAIQTLVEDAQLPVAKGGHMRVDTGFLRASGQYSLNGMPTGPSRPSDGVSTADTTVMLAKLQVGGRIFFGWTANYAKYREYHDGFLGLAVQRWQSIVDESVRKLKQRIT